MLTILRLYAKFLHCLEVSSPAMMLVIRVWIAHIFWLSGLVKISNWDNTLYLFANEYSVPLLPPNIAAICGATFELCCPVLLTLGVASRLATLPLLIMTAVINFTYENLPDHYNWAILLGSILFFGPGKWSIDHLIKKKFGHPAISG